MKKLIRVVSGIIILSAYCLPIMSQNVGDKIDFEVCGEAPEWKRPTLTEHIQFIEANPRYQGFKPEEIENDLLWQSNILSLHNYGLSMMVDIHNLSGLWNAPTDIYFDCDVLKIDTGEIGYLILMQYQVNRVYWDNNQYIVMVKSVEQGVQVVQFHREEQETKLPFKIIDETSGQEFIIIDSDWIRGYQKPAKSSFN
jgi:hypothetical protein